MKLKSLSPLSWTLILGFGLMALFLYFSPQREELPQQDLPWNAHLSEEGQKLHVLGLTLPDSTLEQAMKRYGKDVEIRLFSNKDESHKSLEAYFPVTYVGSIKTSLLLKLKVPAEQINAFYDRGVETTVTSTGQRQVKLSGEDVSQALKAPIEALTLIPKRNLSHRALKMRFGEPENIVKDPQTKIERWQYPQRGLEIIYDPQGPDALQYSLSLAKPKTED